MVNYKKYLTKKNLLIFLAILLFVLFLNNQLMFLKEGIGGDSTSDSEVGASQDPTQNTMCESLGVSIPSWLECPEIGQKSSDSLVDYSSSISSIIPTPSAPAPTITIPIGSSNTNTKTINLPVSCPSFLLDPNKPTNQQYPAAVSNPQNADWGDKFKVDVIGNTLTVTRTDYPTSWGQNLSLIAINDGNGCSAPASLYKTPCTTEQKQYWKFAGGSRDDAMMSGITTEADAINKCNNDPTCDSYLFDGSRYHAWKNLKNANITVNCGVRGTGADWYGKVKTSVNPGSPTQYIDSTTAPAIPTPSQS